VLSNLVSKWRWNFFSSPEFLGCLKSLRGSLSTWTMTRYYDPTSSMFSKSPIYLFTAWRHHFHHFNCFESRRPSFLVASSQEDFYTRGFKYRSLESIQYRRPVVLLDTIGDDEFHFQFIKQVRGEKRFEFFSVNKMKL
jgi:hypothetical protein